MDRPARLRGWGATLIWVLVGLGAGALAGFLAGLLRPHSPSGYARAYVPPPSSDDEDVSVPPVGSRDG